MTTTPELHSLATDPQAFDTILAGMHTRRDAFARAVAAATDNLHRLAGDRKSYRNTRVPVWGLSDNEANKQAQRAAAHGDLDAASVLRDLASAQIMLSAIDLEIGNMGAVYARQGNRWTRFFPSVTKSQPHIHRSLTCRTLHPTTVMTWAPQLSGKTDDQAVAELDEALCSVCFPDAPVALHNYVSRKSTEAQAERDQAAVARMAAKAAKQLTTAEQFKTVGTFHDTVTTVAKCKELVRELPKAEVELAWTREHAARVWGLPADSEQVLRVIRNREDKVREATENAMRATEVLIDREAEHEGWGSTAEAITKMQATARKNAEREWAKN